MFLGGNTTSLALLSKLQPLAIPGNSHKMSAIISQVEKIPFKFTHACRAYRPEKPQTSSWCSEVRAKCPAHEFDCLHVEQQSNSCADDYRIHCNAMFRHMTDQIWSKQHSSEFNQGARYDQGAWSV